MEKKKNCTVRTVPKANQIIVERGKSGDYNWQVEFQPAMLLVQLSYWHWQILAIILLYIHVYKELAVVKISLFYWCLIEYAMLITVINVDVHLYMK